MKKLTLSLLVLIMISGIAFAQDSNKNIRLDRRFGVSLKVMGTTFPAGISFDAFIIPQLNAEVNFIYLDKRWHTVGWGLKYHFIGGKESVIWSPYIGIDFAIGEYDWFDFYPKKLFYVPIGVNYIGEGGFNFAGDIGVMSTDDSINPNFMFSLKFGYRF